MSSPAAGGTSPQNFMRTYALQVGGNIDLTNVYIRDTIMADDTGFTQGPVVIKLPKIGTAYAPVGLRTTIRKPSNGVGMSLLPAQLPVKDSITASTAGAFPNFGAAGAANTTALPNGSANSVTIEATDMALTNGATQPSPVGGHPDTNGAWMIVASSVTGI